MFLDSRVETSCSIKRLLEDEAKNSVVKTPVLQKSARNFWIFVLFLWLFTPRPFSDVKRQSLPVWPLTPRTPYVKSRAWKPHLRRSRIFSKLNVHNVLFIPSLVRVRRPCRGLEKFFPPVLQRCYGCSFHAQEIVHTGHGMLDYYCFCFFSFGEKGACPK